MISDLEDTHSFAMNNTDIIKENEFLVKYNKDTFYNKKLKSYLSPNSNNDNSISIELDEEREEKDEEFKKSFHEVFQLFKDNFVENENKNSFEENIIEDNDFNNEYNGKNKKYENIVYLINKDGKGRSLGRLRRDIIPLYEIKKDKFDKNNILQKIIRNLIFLALALINNAYEGKNSEKKSEPLLRSIDAKEYNVYSNQKIYEFFNKTLGEVFSADISKRNSNFLRTYSKDYNKNAIETLKNENKEKNVVELLNLTMKELHAKYIKEEIHCLSFKNDLIKIEKAHGIRYKDKYEKIALELNEIINKKGEKSKNKKFCLIGNKRV
jgi:hypothetical protein